MTPESFRNCTSSLGETKEATEVSLDLWPDGYVQVTTEASNEVVPTPGKSAVRAAIAHIYEVLVEKGSQYAPKDEYGNFKFQAEIAGVEARQVFRGMIAQKLFREASQVSVGSDPSDSVLDIAGYAVLWLGWHTFYPREDAHGR